MMDLRIRFGHRDGPHREPQPRRGSLQVTEKHNRIDLAPSDPNSPPLPTPAHSQAHLRFERR